MKRRDALTSISALGSGAILLPQLLVSGCDPGPYPYPLFDWGDKEILDEIANVIIPDTPGVPGAKAAGVGEFIQRFVSDCFDPESSSSFIAGFNQFKADANQEFGNSFDALHEEEKVQVVAQLESEAETYDENLQEGQPPHFYTMIRNLTMFGYSTSEIGATKALQYIPVPGKQLGVIPYNGEKAYAL